MPNLSYRTLLTFSSALVFLFAVAKYRPGFGGAQELGSPIGELVGFWLVYIVCTVVLSVVYAVIYAVVAEVRGMPTERIGLKDERDRVTERRAYAVGFWVLFIGSFAAIYAAWSGGDHLLSIVIMTQVAAIGAILAVGVWDELSTLRLGWASD